MKKEEPRAFGSIPAHIRQRRALEIQMESDETERGKRAASTNGTKGKTSSGSPPPAGTGE